MLSRRDSEAGAHPVILSVEELWVRRGSFDAVRGASLQVRERDLAALVGPSGCGKTSLLRAIAGFEEALEGRVRIAGRTVCGEGRWVRPEARQVGMVFQEGALFPHLTLEENVLYGLKGRADAKRRAREVLELVRVGELAGRYPDQLSGGQQQRAALARALAPAPQLVLLDEPFANLDASLRQEVREEVCAILHQAEATALLVTHDQEEALSLADRLAVMEAGRVLQVGTAEEVYLRPTTLAVARLIGEGQLLDCRVTGGEAETALGRAACEGPEGPGHLLVRPEDLLILPRGASGGVEARVLRRRFFGHDRLEELELAGGQRLQVRVLSSDPRPREPLVRVGLRQKRFRAFGAEPGS